MKKLVSLFLFLSLTGCAPAVGATTNTAPEKVTVQLKVDNMDMGPAEGFKVNGEIYLPAWAVAQASNAVTVTDGDTLNVYRRPAEKTRISPRPDGFQEAVSNAMLTLQNQFPDSYKALTENTAVILPGVYTASYAPVNVITLQESVWKDRLMLVAALAHEAEHLRLAHTDRATFEDQKANERSAYTVSLNVLKKLDAPKEWTDREEQYVQDPPTWEDVMK